MLSEVNITVKRSIWPGAAPDLPSTSYPERHHVDEFSNDGYIFRLVSESVIAKPYRRQREIPPKETTSPKGETKVHVMDELLHLQLPLV